MRFFIEGIECEVIDSGFGIRTLDDGSGVIKHDARKVKCRLLTSSSNPNELIDLLNQDKPYFTWELKRNNSLVDSGIITKKPNPKYGIITFVCWSWTKQLEFNYVSGKLLKNYSLENLLIFFVHTIGGFQNYSIDIDEIQHTSIEYKLSKIQLDRFYKSMSADSTGKYWMQFENEDTERRELYRTGISDFSQTFIEEKNKEYQLVDPSFEGKTVPPKYVKLNEGGNGTPLFSNYGRSSYETTELFSFSGENTNWTSDLLKEDGSVLLADALPERMNHVSYQFIHVNEYYTAGSNATITTPKILNVIAYNPDRFDSISSTFKIFAPNSTESFLKTDLTNFSAQTINDITSYNVSFRETAVQCVRRTTNGIISEDIFVVYQARNKLTSFFALYKFTYNENVSGSNRKTYHNSTTEIETKTSLSFDIHSLLQIDNRYRTVVVESNRLKFITFTDSFGSNLNFDVLTEEIVFSDPTKTIDDFKVSSTQNFFREEVLYCVELKFTNSEKEIIAFTLNKNGVFLETYECTKNAMTCVVDLCKTFNLSFDISPQKEILIKSKNKHFELPSSGVLENKTNVTEPTFTDSSYDYIKVNDSYYPESFSIESNRQFKRGKSYSVNESVTSKLYRDSLAKKLYDDYKVLTKSQINKFAGSGVLSLENINLLDVKSIDGKDHLVKKIKIHNQKLTAEIHTEEKTV